MQYFSYALMELFETVWSIEPLFDFPHILNKADHSKAFWCILYTFIVKRKLFPILENIPFCKSS